MSVVAPGSWGRRQVAYWLWRHVSGVQKEDAIFVARPFPVQHHQSLARIAAGLVVGAPAPRTLLQPLQEPCVRRNRPGGTLVSDEQFEEAEGVFAQRGGGGGVEVVHENDLFGQADPPRIQNAFLTLRAVGCEFCEGLESATCGGQGVLRR